MKLNDVHNRTFKTLRVSLTNTCNLACTYCVNDANYQDQAQNISILSVENLVKIIYKINQLLDLQTIRLTGGEPTLYKDIIPLIKNIAKIGPKIKLTTNGFLLKNLVQKLDGNELDSINVSLDALDEDIFFKISKRRSLYKIIEGIDAALAKGIHVKLNCVVIKGVNESQILPILAFAFERKISVRFLEIMKMGHLYADAESLFFSQNDILKVINQKYTFSKMIRSDAATANYWQTSEGNKFGIIANETEPFCGDCNRLRLDSYGNIFGCLSSNTPINITQNIDNEVILEQNLQNAMNQKQDYKFIGSNLSMLEIGG